MLDQILDAIDAGHCPGNDRAAWAERDEAIEDRLIALAEKPLVVIRSSPEIKGDILARRNGR